MLEISSVGAKVKYAFETVSGVRPTSGYTVLPDVNEAPEQDMSPETIDASNITDYVTRYIEGRQDPGGDQSFTLNHTDNVINVWNALAAEAEEKFLDGKQLWFEYWFPQGKKSYFWAGRPMQLGTSGISQNELDTIPAHCVLTDWAGWAAQSDMLSATPTSVSITGTGTATVTVSNSAGGTAVVSSDTSVCTATISTNTVTITGVAAGSAIVTIKDSNDDSVRIRVTVTAS